jgi:hypothetical protein
MDGDDRVLAIVLTAEHLLGFSGLDLDGEIVEGACEVVEHRLTGLGPLGQHAEILGTLAEGLGEIAIFLEAAAALQQLLRGGLILPELRRGDALLYPRELLGSRCDVKDSSAGRRPGAPGPRACEAVLPA